MLQISQEQHTTPITITLRFIAFSHAFPGQSLSDPSAATPERTPKLGAYIRDFVIQIQLDDRDVRRVDNLDPLQIFTSLNSFFGMEGPIVHNPGDY